MFNYGIDGNINLCRRVMLGHVAIQDQLTNKKQDIFFRKFCCDHCQLRQGMDGYLFPQREFKIDTESNYRSCSISLSKSIDVTWLVEETLKNIQTNSMTEFNIFEFKICVCDLISKKLNQIHQTKKTREKKSFGFQMSDLATNEIDMQLLFNCFKFNCIRKCLANDLDVLLQHFGLFKVEDNINGNKLYGIAVEMVAKALIAIKHGDLKFRVRSLPELSKDGDFFQSFYDESNDKDDNASGLVKRKLFKVKKKYDVFDQDDRILLQYKSSHFGLGTPALKMPQIIEARWLMYLPFSVNYEICR